MEDGAHGGVLQVHIIVSATGRARKRRALMDASSCKGACIRIPHVCVDSQEREGKTSNSNPNAHPHILSLSLSLSLSVSLSLSLTHINMTVYIQVDLRHKTGGC